MGPKQKLWQIVDYLLTKAAGAGFVFLATAMFLSVNYNFRAYDVIDVLSNGLLWLAVFGYGVVCSILIDVLTQKIKKRRYLVKMLLYIAAGYACFLPMGWNVYMLYAGTIGAACALLYYAAALLAKRAAPLKYGLAILVPLILLVLLQVDFTVKEQWQGTRDDTSYTASFDYFHGRHDIPIRAGEGETITISLDFTSTNGGGHGFHVLNGKNNLVPMTEFGEEKLQTEVPRSGVYHLVVTGNEVQGSFTVNWEIKRSHEKSCLTGIGALI